MNKLTRAEETILLNQKAILELLIAIHGGHNNTIFYASQRMGYTDQFVKDNRNG